MKIAFYLDNKNSKNIDYSQPYLGNPGVGGTQFMISMLSWYYAKKYSNTDVFLYAPSTENLSNETINIHADSLIDAYSMAEKDTVDLFICRSTNNKSFFSRVNNGKAKVILWGHNFASFKELNFIAKSKMVVQYVCVSKEQLQLIQGHKAFYKSTYIFNAIPTNIYPENNTIRNNRSICYLGSIVPSKGFDVTAKLWRHLYNKGIKLQLHVIGSGQLYNKSEILGEYGIAQKDYEDQFIKYLIDDGGNLHNDVVLHGVLKHKEKIDIMSKAVVGVVNPTGETETFGISAIEFELLNIPVVTFDKGGLKNTVVNEKTGYLVTSFEELVEKTKELLEMYTGNFNKYNDIAQNARAFVLRNFDINQIVKEWNDLFIKVIKGETIDHDIPNYNIFKKIKNYIMLILYKQ